MTVKGACFLVSRSSMGVILVVPHIGGAAYFNQHTAIVPGDSTNHLFCRCHNQRQQRTLPHKSHAH